MLVDRLVESKGAIEYKILANIISLTKSESKTSVDLVVDAAVALENLEGTVVTPWVVPWVNCKPVVLAVFSAVAEDLDGVTTSNTTELVGVDTTLVVEEVFVDGEGTFQGTVVV